jgi:undecaprenyl-diphosphatase
VNAISFVAQWLLIVPAGLVAVVILARRQWKRDLLDAVFGGLATIALVKLAGASFAEARPFVVEHVQPLVAHAPDNAFPSDHLAACGLAFAYLLPRSRIAAIATLVFAGAIGYARVAARLHWPDDVVVGFVLGVAGFVLGFYARRVLRVTSSV